MKTNIEITKKLEDNNCIWTDNLDAVFLLYPKFITDKQRNVFTERVNKHFHKLEKQIMAGKF